MKICLKVGREGEFNFTLTVRNRRNIFQSNVCNLFLLGISVLEAYELQGGGLHKYEGLGFTVKEIT